MVYPVNGPAFSAAGSIGTKIIRPIEEIIIITPTPDTSDHSFVWSRKNLLYSAIILHISHKQKHFVASCKLVSKNFMSMESGIPVLGPTWQAICKDIAYQLRFH